MKTMKFDLDKINEYDIDKHSINKNKIIQILLTPFDDRSIEYLAELKTYLLKISKLPSKFFIEHIDESSYKQIIDSSLTTCEYKRIRYKKTVIYDINKEANYFYIILNGQVRLCKLNKLQKEINGMNYYHILLNYRKKKEYFLLKKTIDDNYYNYPVDYNDMNNIEKILLKLHLMKLEYENDSNYPPDFLENLIRNLGISLSNFGLETYGQVLKRKNEEIMALNAKFINEKKSTKCKKLIEYSVYDARNHSFNNEKMLKEKLKYISPDVCRKYYFFLSEAHENVIYYEFGEEKDISKNDYFGDFENNKYIHRAYSLSDNLELFCMHIDIYKDFLKHERSKIIDSQVTFLLSNFFFEKIKREYFTKNYFHLFETVSYHINQIVVKENEKVDYIYFIKNGTVKLISNRSILETHIIIDLIKNIFNKNNEEKKKSDNNNINYKNYCFKNNLDLLGKEINIKHMKHLITYQRNQCIGFECFYYGVNYLYTAIAMSKEVKIYRIKIKHLIEILNNKGENSLKELGKKAEKKINLLLERFTLINNDLMKFYDRKLINKSKSDREKYIFKSPEIIKDIKNNNNIEDKNNDKLILIKKIFRNKIKKKTNRNMGNRKFSKITNYANLNYQNNISKSNKKLKYNFSEIKDKKNILKSSYNSKTSKKFMRLKSFENIIYKKIMDKEYNTLNLFELSNDKNNSINKNKTLESLSPITKNKNLLFSSPKYAQKKILYDKSLKNKNISKIFDDSLFKDLSYNYNSFNYNFKYDFRKTFNANKKVFKYSIFDYIASPSQRKNNINMNKCINGLNINQSINNNKLNKINNYDFPNIKTLIIKNQINENKTKIL